MTTFAEQHAKDVNAVYGAPELTEEILYDGETVRAKVDRGEERGNLPHHDALADEIEITVRRADVATIAKGTPVVIDGEDWQVFRKTGGGRLTWRLALISGEAPLPRRRF